MRNLGSRSHVFSLDQISLCLLSSQGFCSIRDGIKHYHRSKWKGEEKLAGQSSREDAISI